jgi:hypothetical protein
MKDGIIPDEIEKKMSPIDPQEGIEARKGRIATTGIIERLGGIHTPGLGLEHVHLNARNPEEEGRKKMIEMLAVVTNTGDRSPIPVLHSSKPAPIPQNEKKSVHFEKRETVPLPHPIPIL